jgi:hypothetical protein
MARAASTSVFPPPADGRRATPGRPRDNDRAIALSERRHVELVLYARGLELERDRLLELIRSVHERLAALMKTTEGPLQVREAVEELLKTLAKCL